MDIGEEISRSEQGAALHVKDKKGMPALQDNGTPVTITLAGTDSQRWRTAQDTIANKRLKRVNSRTPNGVKSAEEVREDRAFLLASVTVAWEGIKVDGQPWDCNFETAKKLYLLAPFILEQVDEFVGDNQNF